MWGLDAATLRARLAAMQPAAGAAPLLSVQSELDQAAFERANPDPAGQGRKPVPAAVLVPILHGAEPAILLTKRTATLSAHAGQVSFPGGRIDPQDRDPEAAALREAEEEVGLDPLGVQLLGRLPDHLTATGFRITPVVGLVGGSPLIRLAPAEVESAFQLPFSVLLDPDAPRRQRALLRGAWREYWVWPHPEHHIWGVTAAILLTLAHALRTPPARTPP